jgi:hypothetical protein
MAIDTNNAMALPADLLQHTFMANLPQEIIGLRTMAAALTPGRY